MTIVKLTTGNPFKTLLDKYRLQIGVFLVTVIVVGGGVLALISSKSESSEIEKVVVEATASSTPTTLPSKIKIDIAGAVTNPGVYEIFEDERVEDALNAAGGLAAAADHDWVSKNLNLAAKLRDGDKLYIPGVEEAALPASTNEPAPASVPASTGVVSGSATDSTTTSGCSRVNINTASAAALADCLSGIGTTKAQSIVRYREDHGGFKSIEEIKNVSGIAEGTFAKIRDQITVN